LRSPLRDPLRLMEPPPQLSIRIWTLLTLATKSTRDILIWVAAVLPAGVAFAAAPVMDIGVIGLGVWGKRWWAEAGLVH